MSYIPNENARTLLRRKSRTIGMIVPDIANPFYAEIFRGMQDVTRKRGYSIYLCNTNYEADNGHAAVRELLGRGVDGLVLASFYNASELTRNLIAGKVHTVGIQTTIEGINEVGTNDTAGERALIEHLIELGHTRIGFVSLELRNVKERYSGYLSALSKHGIAVRPEYLVEGFASNTLGYEATRQLLDLPEPPTAIAYINDYTACGGYMAIRERNLRIPEDVSVVGYDDLPIAQLLAPALTTVSQPTREMGRSAARLLLGSIEDENMYKDTLVRLPTNLIVRESTAVPRR